MSRNLVVCCDGTNNQFGPENTNVLRLVEVLVQDPQRQLVYYDPGVGTMPEPHLLTRIGRTISKWMGLAVGAGLMRNVEEAYTFLMQNWEPGDRVYLFGFSRGAYTVRVLAAMLHQMGLLPRDSQNMLPYAVKLFKAIRKDPQGQSRSPDENEWPYWRLCNVFRQIFARPTEDASATGIDQRHFPVHFLGVWDTVSSVGWLWEPVSFPFTTTNPSLQIARHAISIDERRSFFRQNRLVPPKNGKQDLKQHWFPGVHTDVGGGYPLREGGLWLPAYEWLVREAMQQQLIIDPARLEAVLDRSPHRPRSWAEPQHESLLCMWWLAEFVLKKRWDTVQKRHRYMIGLGRRRRLDEGELIDHATLLRIRETDYAPPNLSMAFLTKVRELNEVPPAMEYEPDGPVGML